MIKVKLRVRERTMDELVVAWLVSDGRGGWRAASLEEAVQAINRFEKVRYVAAGDEPRVVQRMVDPASLPMQYASVLNEAQRKSRKGTSRRRLN